MNTAIDPALMVAALDQGAMAFIPKTMPRPALIAALNDVLAGRGYLPANLVSSSLLRPATAGDRAEPERSSELTERQLEVLSLLVQGISNKSICRRLGISENTVKVHVSDPRGAGRWQGPAHPLTFYSTPPETKAALPAGVANRSNTARAASVAVAFVISAAS